MPCLELVSIFWNWAFYYTFDALELYPPPHMAHMYPPPHMALYYTFDALELGMILYI